MAIYSEFSHWKWWFSIVMLVYQRVSWIIIMFQWILIIFPVQKHLIGASTNTLDQHPRYPWDLGLDHPIADEDHWYV